MLRADGPGPPRPSVWGSPWERLPQVSSTVVIPAAPGQSCFISVPLDGILWKLGRFLEVMNSFALKGMVCGHGPQELGRPCSSDVPRLVGTQIS